MSVTLKKQGPLITCPGAEIEDIEDGHQVNDLTHEQEENESGPDRLVKQHLNVNELNVK